MIFWYHITTTFTKELPRHCDLVSISKCRRIHFEWYCRFTKSIFLCIQKAWYFAVLKIVIKFSVELISLLKALLLDQNGFEDLDWNISSKVRSYVTSTSFERLMLCKFRKNKYFTQISYAKVDMQQESRNYSIWVLIVES